MFFFFSFHQEKNLPRVPPCSDEHLLPECRNRRLGVLALNLSGRDWNRADLSLDK